LIKPNDPKHIIESYKPSKKLDTDLSFEEMDMMMDGLAELQSENEKLKSQNEELQKQLNEKNDKLIQVMEENEQLKKQLEEIKKQAGNMIDKIEEAENPDIENVSKQVKQDVFKKNTYKSKIDYKA
jgi:predicted nuclease with TOPRIM domain